MKHVRTPSGAGIPVAPSMEPAQLQIQTPVPGGRPHKRHLPILLASILLASAMVLVAHALITLIGLVSNLVFFQSATTEYLSPAANRLGIWVIFAPAVGGLIVGVMARFGSGAIRGHGIPEAMEQILTNKSRIPARITLLKPLSAAVAIGTGGPFGAEGPIIATGGALGSLLGQWFSTTAVERRILLAAGAVAGMTAIFGTPFAALLLAVELLLFELDARSYLPVACACVTAMALRTLMQGSDPFLASIAVAPATGGALSAYAIIGAVIGLASVLLTRLVYLVEDAFEKLPLHWMWWPSLGGLVVGIVGYGFPQTLGVGYDNIAAILNNGMTWQMLLILAVTKSVSWLIALGSGTSGGTLAPLLMIGGALGGVLGALSQHFVPAFGISPVLAGMVGMAAMFGGASRAMFASVVFMVEATGQLQAFPALMAGTVMALLVSRLLMKQTIMTEKIVRRGVFVPSSYQADPLAQMRAGSAATKPVRTLLAEQDVGDVRAWMMSGDPAAAHQGYPILDAAGRLIGVLTRKDLFAPSVALTATMGSLVRRPPATVTTHQTLREAADMMIRQEIGRIPVVEELTGALIGILTRSDVLRAERHRLSEREHLERAWRPAWYPRANEPLIQTTRG